MVWALDPRSQVAIDSYMKDRKDLLDASAAPTNPTLENAKINLAQIERKMTPILFQIDQAMADLIRVDTNIDQRLRDLKSQEKYNPYKEAKWRDEARTNLIELCCAIQSNPRRRQAILSRSARGLPPLANSGEPEVEDEMMSVGLPPALVERDERRESRGVRPRGREERGSGSGRGRGKPRDGR